MNNQTPSYVDHEKKVFLSKSPDWSAHYTIKFLRINGMITKINNNKVLTVEKLKIIVFDDKNLEKTIPTICRQELKRDVSQWLRESAGTKELNDYLPFISNTTGEEITGKVIIINCYYQASFKYNNGDNVGVC